MQTAEADSQRLRSSVKSTETVALTEDVILTTPSATTELLDMFEMMVEDFRRVLGGDIPTSFFERMPDEDWKVFSDRVASMVPGMGTKIAAFGIYWQNPFSATIGAVDIHIVGMVGEQLLKTKYADEAVVWYDRWQNLRDTSVNTTIKEAAASQLYRETNKKPSKTAINRRAAQIKKAKIAERSKVPFEKFISADVDNPAYTYWRERLQRILTNPLKLNRFPTSVPQLRKRFPHRRIDSKAVREALDELKADKKVKPDLKKERISLLERAIKAHEHVESVVKKYGPEHPVVREYIDDVISEPKSRIEVMSDEYKMVLSRRGWNSWRCDWFSVYSPTPGVGRVAGLY